MDNCAQQQRVVEMQVPMQVFFALLQPFETGDLEDLEWTDETKTGLVPTSTRVGCNTYQYNVRRPAQLNQLWDMASWDRRGRAMAARPRGAAASFDTGGRAAWATHDAGELGVWQREPVLPGVPGQAACAEGGVLGDDAGREEPHIMEPGLLRDNEGSTSEYGGSRTSKNGSGQLVSNADSGARAVGDDSAAAEHGLAAGGDNDGDGSSCARRRRLDSSSVEVSATTFASSNNLSPPPLCPATACRGRQCLCCILTRHCEWGHCSRGRFSAHCTPND